MAFVDPAAQRLRALGLLARRRLFFVTGVERL